MKVIIINSSHISGLALPDLLGVRGISHVVFSSPLDFIEYTQQNADPFVLITEIFTSLDTGQQVFYEMLDRIELLGVLLISKHAEDIIHATKSFLQETKVKNVRAVSGSCSQEDIVRNIERLKINIKKQDISSTSQPGANFPQLCDVLQDAHIVPHYQPKVRAADEQIVGYEVLSRLKINNKICPPSSFIPNLIEQEKITEYTCKLFKVALKEVSTLRKFDKTLSFNVDYQSLRMRGFADQILSIAERFGFPLDQLTIEVTENASALNGNVIANLTKFRIKGCNVSIDDFGMNHCGFTELLKLPFTEIKIDRSYVVDIVESNRAFDLVRALSSVASCLGITIVAEGIETLEQRDKLRSIHIDYFQGYMYGKPTTIDNVAHNESSVSLQELDELPYGTASIERLIGRI
ncbi:EAL domain-containing protein [Vibrio hannami]|uniref:EAL domain-containing protein n=1 Tax=Vibrio hannami TaxID=2717094 RepID=UPI00240F5D9A|nr:EAL domain-containing protein [Vibrio hannami]MDG3085926.1 EAL domain-containing protein [Vibrio hannami]